MARPRRSAGKRQRRAKRAARSPTAQVHAIQATLADIAHEIRTPLTGVVALGELLATSELGARERGWATAIKGTAEHLVLLTSLIIDAARADAKRLVLRRELIRPRRLLDALAASLAARADAKGIEHAVDIPATLPEAVIGDPLRLRAALENLIENAVKFTERGSVRLAAGCERAARGKVRLMFTVTDSGIGLSSAEIKRLFQPFAQASDQVARRYGGAGLGLTLAKRVAKAMGGQLTVASEPGHGSRFRMSVTVDEVAEAPGTAASDGAAARDQSVHPLSVLCVEANPHGRVLLNTILAELGHRADFVGTGAAAVEAVTRGGYDVVLMNVVLPDIDGLEATRRIRTLADRAGRMPIVGVFGRASAGEEDAARAAGMNGYLTKPLSPGALTQVLGSVMVQT
ncbi:MAG TPA: ATP-binding protein [Xanthobacteraceae bacterium]|jgi:CheY-like chemotaxis protein/nitrogen-specific signal transduction histidine kinase|nr:ATP-binding protein [Xanthobacteraceae bacterium]